MHPILDYVSKTLAENIDEKTKTTAQNWFKEPIQYYGVKVVTVTKISRESYELIKDLPKNEILSLCEELWKTGVSEDSYIACNWSYYTHDRYEESDLEIFERWIEKYVSNWSSCDTLCNHTVGEYLEMFPHKIDVLKRWATSSNRWMKRAAAVSLIIPTRKGLFHNDVIEIADLLFSDKDDLVQKGYGWMLKATSQSNEKLVFDYVMAHKATMPRTALRYAIEKMPKELKKLAMEK